PPVAAEEGAAAAKADRRRDRDALVAGDDDDEILGHRPRDLGEELAAEIRRAAAPQESARMKIVHRVPVGRRKLVAAGMLEADARLGAAPPLAPRFLAFLRAERREKLVEISIAAVVPMELTALTGQVPGRGERRAFRLRREETVRGRRVELAANVLGRAEQRRFDLAPRLVRRDEQPAPGGRSDRDRRDELRVVA